MDSSAASRHKDSSYSTEPKRCRTNICCPTRVMDVLSLCADARARPCRALGSASVDDLPGVISSLRRLALMAAIGNEAKRRRELLAKIARR